MVRYFLWTVYNCVFGHLLFDVFSEASNSAHLSEQLANVIKVSEKHWKNGEQLFQNVKGHISL